MLYDRFDDMRSKGISESQLQVKTVTPNAEGLDVTPDTRIYRTI